ncbi:phosphoadenosine phosphosulfate (PAPS) reductase family protein [Abeliophyllum distichum]|uniref:Phosphoadenosine phosphosulfate (PAPS) reductase family protein n=1 Tax=Abeliophyllum distichum TaxID=126358 RepID=A0ABD1RHF8_9LAMI
MGSTLCRKLHSIGWAVSQLAVTRNDVDYVAEEVERRKSANDMVFMYGGFGPLPSDITVAGVAKAFGVRMAPDEEFEEYLRHCKGEKCIGDSNEIKCQNVVILSATNVGELDQEWHCLIELLRSSGSLVITEPFVSKRRATTLSNVEAAQPLSEISIKFPDIYIGGYRELRNGQLVITFEGKKTPDCGQDVYNYLVDTGVNCVDEEFLELPVVIQCSS